MKTSMVENAVQSVVSIPVVVKYRLIKVIVKTLVGITICVVVAPQACLDLALELASGVRLMSTGMWALVIEHGTNYMVHEAPKAVGKGIIRGFSHPTEGAIGWDIVSMIKSLF